MKSPKKNEIFLSSSTTHPQLRNPPPVPRHSPIHAYTLPKPGDGVNAQQTHSCVGAWAALEKGTVTGTMGKKIQRFFNTVVFEFYLWQSFLWQSKKEASKSYRDFWLSDVARKLFPTGFNFYGHLEDSHSGQISNQIYCARSKKTSHLLGLNLLAFLGVKF